MRTLQEWMGHRDYKTTMIYADYAPGAHEVALVNDVFSSGWDGTSTGTHPLASTNFSTSLSTTRLNSAKLESEKSPLIS